MIYGFFCVLFFVFFWGGGGGGGVFFQFISMIIFIDGHLEEQALLVHHENTRVPGKGQQDTITLVTITGTVILVPCCFIQVTTNPLMHYNVIMSMLASQITILTIAYSTVYSGTDQRKHQSSVWLAFLRGIHWWPGNSLHWGPVTRNMFPFDDIIMDSLPVDQIYLYYFLTRL